MRFLGCCGLGLLGAVSMVACGASEKSGPQGQSGSAGSSASAGSGQGGSAGKASDGGSAGSSQAGRASGGSSDGVGSGELDASCRERTTNHIAGSEIGLRERVTAEGDRAFVAFYDKQTGEECTFLQDAEGVTRCFPPTDGDQRFFADASCKQRVAYRGICGSDAFALPVSDDSCDKRRRVFRYGAARAAGMVWERGRDGVCREYGELNNLYEAGEELASADYPAVTEIRWRGVGRVARDGYEGPGGLQIVRSFRDATLGERCASQTLADGKVYCAPYELGSLAYSDDSCSKTLLSTEATCGAPGPKFGAARTAQSCLGKTYVEHGEPFTGTLYERSGCMAANASVTEGLQVSTPKIVSPDRFPTIEPVVAESDEGRLKPVYSTIADGGCWFEGWYDSEQETDCDFAQTNDQQYRCVPPIVYDNSSGLLELFTDPTCSESVTYYGSSCPSDSPPKLITRVVQESCVAPTVEVRPVLAAAPVPLPPHWWKQDGACQTYPHGSGSTFYELGDPLPPDTFMAAELAPE